MGIACLRAGTASLLCGTAALLCGTALAVQAQAWSVATDARAGVERDDNPALTATRSSPVTTRRWGFTTRVAGETETEKTRAELQLQQVVPGGLGARAEGLLALRHEVALPRDRYSLTLETRHDRPLDAPASAAEAAVGAERRRQRAANATWTHRWSERLDLQAQLADSRSTFDTTMGGATRRRQAQRSASLGATWSLDEATQLGGNVSRSEQDLETEQQRFTVDSWRVDLDRQATETVGWRLSLGSARSERAFTLGRLACPLPSQFCDSGLVRPIVVFDTFVSGSRESTASGSLNWRADERSSLSASGARALTPGISGTARETQWDGRYARRIDERTELGASFAKSRSQSADGPFGASDATLQTVSATLEHALAPRWSLSARLERRQFSSASAIGTGLSHRLSINLQYSGATMRLSR